VAKQVLIFLGFKIGNSCQQALQPPGSYMGVFAEIQLLFLCLFATSNVRSAMDSGEKKQVS